MSHFKRKYPFNKNNSYDSSPRDIRDSTPPTGNGFEGFYLYFNKTSLDDESVIQKTKHFKSYINTNNSLFSFTQIKENGFFTIDYKEILKDEFLKQSCDNLQRDFIENTEETLKCIGLAMHQTICDFEKEKENNEYIIPIVHCRLINVEPVLNIKDVRANRCNKLVAVKGAVIKTSDKQHRCIQMEFKCNQCEQTLIVKQKDGCFTTPNLCIGKGCRAQSKFIPLLASKYTQTINYQNIRIQEVNDDDSRESARIPRFIPCLLENDLVSSCVLGDDVTIIGIVKMESEQKTNGFKRKNVAVYDIYIEAISVINEKTIRQQNSFPISPKIIFNTSDYYQIEKIHSEENLFQLLVHSLCPNIYGHEIVKAGLLLSLFGGTESAIEKRKDCHVLLMGDPGLGKSQMLQACCNIAPGGVYVCGNTSTAAGLTVTVNRESGGEYTLEAGALVLADQGCCCIDEFDKGPSQNSSLLEVMEQQSISIAKAGISRNIPTRTTILAAANPVGGHYNHSKTVVENLKINPALLSRFDLIFIILDRSDEKSDLLLSEHVLALHTSKKNKKFSRNQNNIEATSSGATSLKQSLLLQPNEEIDPIPHSLVRKYIAYAQKYVKPQLSTGAKRVLEEFYLDLRGNRNSTNFTPVTARQLESIKRLTQARAKLELREEATAEDAAEVIEIIKYSIASVVIDEDGSFDYGRSPSGTGISGRKQVSKFLMHLEDISNSNESKMFSLGQLRDVAAQAGVAKDRFYNTLQLLNLDGILLKKPDNMYQLISSEI